MVLFNPRRHPKQAQRAASKGGGEPNHGAPTQREVVGDKPLHARVSPSDEGAPLKAGHEQSPSSNVVNLL